MSNPIAGPAADALNSLTTNQRKFIWGLPKAELHAHLSGSIPLSVLQELARDFANRHKRENSVLNEKVQQGLKVFLDPAGPSLEHYSTFYRLFSTIHALTSTPGALKKATKAVLEAFLEPSINGDNLGMDGEAKPQCSYLELRTTPRKTDYMTKEEYLQIVLHEMRPYTEKEQAGLIVCIDRSADEREAQECIDLAKRFRGLGECIVGVDLCGFPTAGDTSIYKKLFDDARSVGLGVTLHIAETKDNTAEDTMALLECSPDRLGHATFMNEKAKEIVEREKICIEICLSSNIVGDSYTSLESHHILHYLELKHPVVICTDDILPFRTMLVAEYALLMAPPPTGLGLSEDVVKAIAETSLKCRFRIKAPIAIANISDFSISIREEHSTRSCLAAPSV